MLSSRFQIELVSCKNALATFGIERTPEIRVQLNFPPPLDLRTGDEDPAIVIGPTEDSALQSQEQLPPPTDPGRN